MIQFEKVSYQLSEPIITARGKISNRVGYFIRIRDHDNSGEGEILPLPGWSSVPYQDLEKELENISQGINFVPSDEVRSGINMANWNLKALQIGAPLWSVLGGVSNSIKVNGLIGGIAVKEFPESLERLQRDGYSVIKVKLGFSDDLERIKLLSEVLSSTQKVRLDPNGMWSLGEASERLEYATKTLGERLEYVEDPVSTLDELFHLRKMVSVPIAADDLIRKKGALEYGLQNKLMDYVVVKPSLVGGIDDTLQIAKEAQSNGIQVVISSTYDGPVGLRTWCHLAAYVSPDLAHGLGTAVFINDKGMGPLVPTDGKISLT